MKCLRYASGLIAIVGIATVLQGLWIPAKAILARGLLVQAFSHGKAEGINQKPWPSADFGVMGKVTIDGNSIFVLDKASGQALAFGAGRHEEYDPITGPLVLSGHRDTHFAVLERVKTDDMIVYENLSEEKRYKVIDTSVFDLRGDSVIAAPAQNQLLLITCWPFHAVAPHTPQRFLVLAEAIAE